MLRDIFRLIRRTGKDKEFLGLIKLIETIVSKILSLAMIVVILVTVYDLVVFLVQDIFFKEPVGFFTETLIEIFGLFLNVLIALEILENITAYLRKHVVQVELVIITSLIAVARKIIILDFSKTTGVQLIGLSIAIFALSISYWIIRSVKVEPNE